MRALRTLAVVAAAAITAAGPGQEPSYAEFRDAFNRALRDRDTQAVDQAIRLAPHGALLHFTALCNDQRIRYSTEIDDVQQAMKDSWRRIHGEDTLLARYQEYFGRQPVNLIAELEAANLKMTAAHARLADALRSRARQDLESVRDQFTETAETFAQLGDELHAAQAWQAVVYVCDQLPEKSAEEQEELVHALRMFLAHREAWGWTGDSVYEQNRVFLQTLTSPAVPVAAAVPMETPYDPDAVELVLDLEFSVAGELETDMFVKGGPVPTLWPYVQLVSESHARLTTFEGGDLFLRRDGGRFLLSDGAAGGDRPVELRVGGGPRLNVFELGDGSRYAMWVHLGGVDEPFLSTELNLAPTPERALLYLRSAASWSTTVAGIEVTFFDDNCDGILFDPDPYRSRVALRTLGAVTEEGILVPAYDSVRVGRGPRVPLSRYARIGEDWFAIRRQPGPRQVSVRRLDPERLRTGTVVLDWRHTRQTGPEVMIVQGLGTIAGTAFDLSDGEPVEVPAGEYEIGFGRIAVGRGPGLRMAWIFKGDAASFTVEPGATVELAMGAPFRLDFERDGTDGDLVLDATTIRVLGMSGAVYTNLHNAVPAPRVLASRSADGRNPRRIAELRPVVDPDVADLVAAQVPLLNYTALAFPLPRDRMHIGDPVLRQPIPGGTFIGLHQRSHPLFDELHPIWK